jgi:hypothetical protein
MYINLVGIHHEILFEYCNCYTVPECLVQCGVWPATPVEPSVAFILDLMEMTLRLMMECQVSIHDMLRALDFFKNPLLKVRNYHLLIWKLVIIMNIFVKSTTYSIS